MRGTMALNRRQFLRRFPKPEAPEGGMYLVDPMGGEVFVTFDQLRQMCEDIMSPAYATIVESDLGKMPWHRDPTYDMKRKK